MPPKAAGGRPSAMTSGSSTSATSSSSSSSSSTDSDSSSDSDASSATNKTSGSSSDEKKKKNAANRTTSRSSSISSLINNSDNEGRKKSGKKSSGSKTATPKVVPKKSATAKPVPKANLKNKKPQTTIDSESEVDDSTIYSVSKLREKSEKSKKKTMEKTKSKKEEEKKPPKPTPTAMATSTKASKKKDSKSDDDISLMDTDSEDDSRDKKRLSKSPKKQVEPKKEATKKGQDNKRRTRLSSVDSDLEARGGMETELSSAESEKEIKKTKPKPNKPSPKQASSKVERPTTRKQTRGTAIKKSVHVTGTTVGKKDDTDSESETEDRGRTSPSKRSAATRNPASLKQASKPRPNYRPLEDRNCPVPGCDSKGHLSGRRDRHFTHDACPIYHNTTAQACRETLRERTRKEEKRLKSINSNKSRNDLLSPTSEQKRYLERVKDDRKQPNDFPTVDTEDDDDDLPITERERGLQGLTSEYDLALFREAQAQASEKIEDQLKGLPDAKGTKILEMGHYEMEVWYQSPYPEDYTVLPKIYICEFCLKYMKAYSVMKRHSAKCVWKHPPGDEIYRKEKLSVFEVCGKKYKQYCQNLCLIAKCFLDHKTLYDDVEPFLFYVMTTADSEGCHIVGYFSKEKNSLLNYNVSCILTLPPYQRKGYGRLLIDFSYLLSKMEGKIGSPEKPLSDLGLLSYRAYWKDVLLEYLTKDSWVVTDREISVKAISEEMGIHSYDIISTLQFLEMIKYWRGKHIILKKEDVINEFLDRQKRRPRDKEICAEYLKWKPYEPTAKEKRQAEQIKKKQEERQKGR